MPSCDFLPNSFQLYQVKVPRTWLEKDVTTPAYCWYVALLLVKDFMVVMMIVTDGGGCDDNNDRWWWWL